MINENLQNKAQNELLIKRFNMIRQLQIVSVTKNIEISDSLTRQTITSVLSQVPHGSAWILVQ